MASADSLVDLHDASFDDKDDVDSLPSISTDDIYSEADSDAQAEWDRSLEQLQLILTMMIVPWMGKYFGRKFAYWSKDNPELSSRHHDNRSLLTYQPRLQLGQGTWSGRTMSTFDGQTKRPSRRLERWKLQRRYR